MPGWKEREAQVKCMHCSIKNRDKNNTHTLKECFKVSKLNFRNMI